MYSSDIVSLNFHGDSLWKDGIKVATAKGGGYEKKGYLLSRYLEKYGRVDLNLTGGQIEELTTKTGESFNSIETDLRTKYGFELEYIPLRAASNERVYIIRTGGNRGNNRQA